jgi:hypothetical protein
MRYTADVTVGKPIAVLLQPISGVSAINPLVAFYDIPGGKREVVFFYFVPDTTRDNTSYILLKIYLLQHYLSDIPPRYPHLKNELAISNKYRRQIVSSSQLIKASFPYPYPTKSGRHNMFSSSILYRQSTSIYLIFDF